jgi:3-dehydroquinate dehydratase-2
MLQDNECRHCAEYVAGLSIRKPFQGPATYPVTDFQKILFLNGPNLNLLGVREPDIYGTETLADIERLCADRAVALSLSVEFCQSNSESDLIGWIQQSREGYSGIIINPAAYTHSSIAIMDALAMLDIPIIELHLSNIHRRESFRHQSYVSLVASGIICGFGAHGYELALGAMANLIGTKREA